jgi:hypothetical protein
MGVPMRGRMLCLMMAGLMAAPLPAAARELSLQQKSLVVSTVRGKLKDVTARFRWLPVANDAIYCGLVKPAKSTAYMPFQIFGITSKKLNVNIAADVTTAASVRESCERYNYNFSQYSE